MSAIFGETLTFTQATGEPIRLVVFGDDMFARYETLDGFTVVYDEDIGRFCYANTTERGIASSGVPADEPPPRSLARHQHASKQLRNERVRDHLDGMLPVESSSREREALLTFGPSGGLLPGRVLNNGSVRGLTILITFPDTPSTVTKADVTALLNGPNYRANGNASSVAEYFETMSTGRLHFTNDVVGPYQMSRPKLAYANVDGLLVPEALQLALDHGVDFSDYDSLGQGIVDAVCIMYAGRTEYRGDLWPHNWVHRKTSHGVRTELYIVTSMGRRAQDLSIGTFCHESGHLLFRWPDLYDYGLAEREGDDFKSSGHRDLLPDGGRQPPRPRGARRHRSRRTCATSSAGAATRSTSTPAGASRRGTATTTPRCATRPARRTSTSWSRTAARSGSTPTPRRAVWRSTTATPAARTSSSRAPASGTTSARCSRPTATSTSSRRSTRATWATCTSPRPVRRSRTRPCRRPGCGTARTPD